MSGHSEFAPIGNRNPQIPMPQVGGVGNSGQLQTGAPGVQPPGQQGVEHPDPPAARSLAQKLDSMLVKAAKMSVRSVDGDSLKAVTQKLKLGKAELQNLNAAAEMARQTLNDVSGFTGREIASAMSADDNGVFDWTQNAAAAAIRAAIDAGNPVKPVGDFQLQRKRTNDPNRCVVTVASRQVKSLFIRDLYGKVVKSDWFK